MLAKLWKSYSNLCGKLLNVDNEKEWADLKERWKGMRKSPKEFVRLYIEKVKENFQWIKGYKDFPIYKIGSGLILTSIFITSVPEKVSNYMSTQRLKYNLENCLNCTYEQKLLMIERYENRRKLEQYGAL
tara:strand:+ start:137 stop:526 length:390 start_codon:yes stop_codon:yes gene_type:complete